MGLANRRSTDRVRKVEGAMVTAPAANAPTLEVACNWCHGIGVWGVEIEPIQTAGGERKRCIDRESCRGRAVVLHKHLYGVAFEVSALTKMLHMASQVLAS